MRTILPASLALLGAWLLAAPAALAANDVGPTDIILADTDGNALRFIPQDDIIRIQITLTNSASTQVDDTLTLSIRIDRDGVNRYDQTIRRAVTIPAGGTTVVEQSWPPAGRQLGEHTMTVAVQDSDEPPFAATFTVTETAVESGSYAEKIARYSWFMGAFVLALALFAVVLAARRA